MNSRQKPDENLIFDPRRFGPLFTGLRNWTTGIHDEHNYFHAGQDEVFVCNNSITIITDAHDDHVMDQSRVLESVGPHHSSARKETRQTVCQVVCE